MNSTCSTYKKDYKCVKPPNKIKLLIVGEAPPKEDENYFYCLANSNTKRQKRKFFHNLMKGVGLLEEDEKWEWNKENKLLDAFLENDYFLIDTCHKPLKGKKPKEKIEEMVGCVCNLICQIRELNPEKVIFIFKTTNTTIRDLVEKKGEFPNGMIYEKVLPAPLYGNLTKFIEEFPVKYRLSPIF